jgi:hypothetical protein
MAELFDEHLRNVTIHFERAEEFPSGQGPLKTYLVEAHSENGGVAEPSALPALLNSVCDRFGFGIQPTEDPTLFLMSKRDTPYFVDVLNPRFWLVHTTANIDPAETFLTEMVQGAWNLDYAWLPSQVLEYFLRDRRFLGFNIDFDQGLFFSEGSSEEEEEKATVFKSRYWGTGGESLFQFLKGTPTFRRVLCLSGVKYSIADPQTRNYIINELNSNGRIKATGNSITLHLSAINHVASFYSQMIESIENRIALWFSSNGREGILEGYPLRLVLSEPLSNIHAFVGELLSCRAPLRLWGTVDVDEKDFIRAEVVDLHSASRLRMDVTPDAISIYLFKGACGNSIARIVRNIQEHLDPTVHIRLDGPSVLDQCSEV